MDERAFYPHSFEEAKRNNCVDLYKESHAANIDCKNAIEKAINDNFDGYRLNKDISKDVIAKFGFDRIKYVLSYTFQSKDLDGRISRENKAWAKDTYVPEDLSFGMDRRTEFLADAHSGLLDLFANQFQKEYKLLGLWDKSQVHPPDEMNFTGKIMVIKPEKLSEPHKTRDEQLFYAFGGFGCNPESGNKKVMGEFLCDGERTHFYRLDFLGEAKADLLPPFAKDRLAEIKAASKEKEMPVEKPMAKPSVLGRLAKAKEQIATAKQTELKKDKEER